MKARWEASLNRSKRQACRKKERKEAVYSVPMHRTESASTKATKSLQIERHTFGARWHKADMLDTEEYLMVSRQRRCWAQ
jgi:hypothetical protein